MDTTTTRSLTTKGATLWALLKDNREVPVMAFASPAEAESFCAAIAHLPARGQAHVRWVDGKPGLLLDAS